MNLIKFFILRPIFASVISLVTIVMGLFFFTKLPVLNMPEYFQPKLTINAYLEGADPKYMEKEITSLIEKNIKNIKNLVKYTSSSYMGGCSINLIFNESADIEISLNDTRSAISSLSGRLPENMQLPTVSKVGSNDRDSVWIAISSKNLSSSDLSKIVIDQVKPVLERLSSTGKVQISGRKYNEIGIILNNIALFKYKISPYEIEQKIKNSSKNFPLGKSNWGNQEFSLQMNNSIKEIEDLKNIILSKSSINDTIKLQDVAEVKFIPGKIYDIWHCDGNKCVGIGITKASSSNSILLAKQVIKALNNLKNDLSDLVTFSIVYDESIQLIESIKSVGKSIVEAIILVSVIIFLFLGSLRLSIVPIVTIPISIIGTFFIMHLLNFSINMFTLLAISLSIGMVVDDAIVILENINRHIKVLGKSKLNATIDATTEIASAVIAMTITLAAVFIPVGFMKGEEGKQFTEFAWTLASCVGVSGIVALTLSPMLTLKLASNSKREIKSVVFIENFLNRVENFYDLVLKKVLNNKMIVIIISIIIVTSSFFAFSKIEKTVIPDEDLGIILISYRFPEGQTIFECEKTVNKVESILANYKEVKHYMSPIWNGTAFTFLSLKDYHLRKRSQSEIIKELNIKIQDIREASIFCFSPMGGGGKKSGIQLEFLIKSTKDYEELYKNVSLLMENLKSRNLCSSIYCNFSKSQPTIKITPDKTKMHLYNVDIQNVASSIQYLSLEKDVCELWLNDDSYNVVMSCKNRSDNNIINNLRKILVKSNNDEFIPLVNIVKMEVTGDVQNYTHHDGSKAITVTMSLNDNINLVDAMNEVKKSFLETIDPLSFAFEFEGFAKKLGENESNMLITFLFSLLLIFLVLAAQFESFGDSLMILCSVPFSIVGGILGLWIFSETANIFSYIGFISLIGLITKNAIMIVEFANQLLLEGKSKKNSIIEASKIRLKPILMTSISTIMGAFPLIISSGAGAGANHSLGMVIFFGMLLGTIFTLIIIPVLYYIFKKEPAKTDFI